MPRKKKLPSAAAHPWTILTHIGLVIVTALLLLWGFQSLHDHQLMGDERFHYGQIVRFLRGDLSLEPALATLPGYHALIAAFASLGIGSNLVLLRGISLVLSALSVVLFFLCARFLDRQHALLRTLQYVLLPILFPFLFLLYTDMTSLALVFACLLATLKRHYWLAGICMILCMATRQNAIVWLLLFLCLLWIHHSVSQSIPHEPALREIWRRLKEVWADAVMRRRALVRSLVHVLGMALFIAFVFWNGGIAMGDRDAHPFPAIYLSNVYFLLFLFFFLFLPLHIANIPRIRAWLREHADSVFVSLTLLFLVYWFTFHNTHINNQVDDWWWLRNRILVTASASPLGRILFFLPILYSVLSLRVTRLMWSSFYVLYPFTVLALLPSWLIEQRYYFVPFSLFLLFREGYGPRTEMLFVLYSAVFTTILFHGIPSGGYFL